MVRLNGILAAGVLSFLVLTGCNDTNKPAASDTTTPPAATSASDTKASDTKSATDTKAADTPATDTKSATDTKATDTKSATDTKATDAKTPVDAKAGFASLQEVTSSVQKSVAAGKFDEAKKEFEKFEPAWGQVEDGVKAKSADSYKQIEEAADKVSDSLKAAKPDKAKTTAAVDALSKSLDTYAKSVK